MTRSTIRGEDQIIDSSIVNANIANTTIELVKLVEGADLLKKSENLSNLADNTTARTNLGVYSSTEVDDKITAAKLALGTTYVVADITARDALENLTLNDIVLVEDDGDGKWAQYTPTVLDINGSGTTWLKITDQDSLENSISASAIKTAYESNANTNAFTDAEKTKLSNLTTADSVVTGENLTVTNGSAVLGDTANTPIAGSVAVYINGLREFDFTIAGSTITLGFTLKTTGAKPDEAYVDYRY